MSTISNMALQSGEPPQVMMFLEVSSLENEGVVKAMETWGQPKSRLTHLVFYALSHFHGGRPSPDCYLAELLGCPVIVHHYGYEQGNYHEGTIMGLFRKFTRENQSSGLALFVCSEYKPVPTRNAPSGSRRLLWYDAIVSTVWMPKEADIVVPAVGIPNLARGS